MRKKGTKVQMNYQILISNIKEIHSHRRGLKELFLYVGTETIISTENTLYVFTVYSKVRIRELWYCKQQPSVNR